MKPISSRQNKAISQIMDAVLLDESIWIRDARIIADYRYADLYRENGGWIGSICLRRKDASSLENGPITAIRALELIRLDLYQ